MSERDEVCLHCGHRRGWHRECSLCQTLVCGGVGCKCHHYEARPPVVAHVEGEWPRKKTT